MEGGALANSASLPDWPDWILAVGPETPSALQTIADACARFRLSVKESHVSEQVWQRQLTDLSDDQIDNGILDLKGNWLKPVSLPRNVAIGQLYNSGSPVRILEVLIFAKQAALVQLVDMTRVSLAAGSLLVALGCLRSLIEHIAHFDHVIAAIRPYSVPPNWEEANKMLWEVNGKLLTTAYATRVDWGTMLLGETEELLERNKIKYEPNEKRMDHTAKSVMNAIDALTKQVKGTRAVYDVLCEFTHPNIGTLFGLTRSAGPVEDVHGLVWVRKEFSLLPPIGALKELGPAMDRIFATAAECVSYFERTLIEAGQERDKVLRLAQAVVQRLLLKNRDLIEPYAPCPCASGSKVKFCCGGGNVVTTR